MKNEPEGFPAFWDVWKIHQRKTDGRALARECFAKHIKAGADPQDIVDGAKCFFRTMKDKDRDFVPLSATWINRGAYEDLAPQEREHQAKMAEVQSRRVEQIKREAQEPASERIDPERRRQLADLAKRAASNMRAN